MPDDTAFAVMHFKTNRLIILPDAMDIEEDTVAYLKDERGNIIGTLSLLHIKQNIYLVRYIVIGIKSTKSVVAAGKQFEELYPRRGLVGVMWPLLLMRLGSLLWPFSTSFALFLVRHFG